MDEPIRVLHVITGMGSGGAESFLMNMYRHMDHTKVQFDFLLRSNENYYVDEIEKMGGYVYYTAAFPSHAIKNYCQVREILKNSEYNIVHVHANALYYMTAILEAKRQGIQCRIMHSHSSSTYRPQYVFIHEWFKRRIHKIATDCFACSEDAGLWMFDKNYKIIHNAIDLKRFQFDQSIRNQIRSELSIPDNTFVIGHVGRFLKAKNHQFIIEVFQEIISKHEDSILILVGEGELQTDIKQQVNERGLEKNVKFLGARKDVGRLYNAFDIMIFPSLFEGLPIVAIEAQVNGIPMFCSEALPEEAVISKSLHRIQLSAGAEKWADEILRTDFKRISSMESIINAGYDIRMEAKKLQDFYTMKAMQNGVLQ